MLRNVGVALVSVLALIAGLGSAECRAGYGYTQIVAFGDSLVDTGNTYLYTTTTPGQTPTPASPPYFQGHYSNGPIWVEYLANRLGVPLPTPSLTGGTDYAWGGAETGLSGVSNLYKTPNIGTQISAFLATGQTLTPSSLVVLWGGANDFLTGGVTNPAVVVNNLVSEITTLYHDGGRNFVVPNLPQLGLTPFGLTLPAAEAAGLNALTLAYDAELASAMATLQANLAGSHIVQPNIEALVRAISNNPSAYGFTNVTQEGLNAPNGGIGYLYWDSVHPTTQGHMAVANLVFAAVPEPSSSALMSVAGVILVVAGHSRRKARATARA